MTPQENAEHRERLREFESLCPENYQELDLSQLPDPESGRLIIEHWRKFGGEGHDPRTGYAPNSWGHDKPGLILQGGTGEGKTFVMWGLVKRLIVQEWNRVNFVSFKKWTDQTSERAKNCALADWSEEVLTYKDGYFCNFLFIEDLGRAKLDDRSQHSGSVSAAVYDLIETATGHKVQLLITTRCTKAELFSRFGEHSTDIVRRLLDYCTAIQFNKKQWLKAEGMQRRGRPTPGKESITK